MLRLFNPIQILKMDNQTVEAIAAEDRQTRDRRLALKDQKVAIEEAKSLCASLAMRSELRGGADDDDDDESEDDDDHHRRSSRGHHHQQYVAPQYLETRASRDPRYEDPHNTPRPQQNPSPARRPVQEQQRPATAQENTQSYRHAEPVSPVSSRLSRGDSVRASSEWANGYYTTSADGQAPSAPTSAPPPPPRPPKPEYEEEPRYSRDGGQREREREGKREGTRHRIMGSLAR